MNPLFSDTPEFSERFLDEGRLLAAAHHGNIITIHDIGTGDGFRFISMEYVEGGDVVAISAANRKCRFETEMVETA